jgi:hypothetical protein
MPVAKTKTAKVAAKPVKAKALRKKAIHKADPKAGASTRRKTTKVWPVADPATMDQEIQLLAYKLWEERGCPEGSGLDDWARAEQHILSSAGA